jgi:hypothetical protein
MGGGEGVFFSPQWQGTDRSCGGYKPWKFVWQSKSGAWDVELQGAGRRLGLLLFALAPGGWSSGVVASGVARLG